MDMTADRVPDRWKELVDELRNFQEMARYLNPAPGEIPELQGVDICGLSMPLRDVIGGDHTIYIDFNRRYDLDRRIAHATESGRDKVAEKLRSLKQRAGILVADVSGHRMTDAFIGAMLHQAFLLGAHYELDRYGEITTRIFEQINTRFYRTTAINKYFTMIYGEISTNGKFRFLSAGHQPPTVFSREFGCFVKISEDRLVSFPPVGMFPSSRDPDDAIYPDLLGHKKLYEVNEINLLNVGDILLVHTDGLVEHAGGEYFPGRVEKLLVEAGDESAEQICTMLREDVLAAAAPDDDISVVVIRRTQ
jgi:serine phosphatase RsbU (regulator of sigma subunit)